MIEDFLSLSYMKCRWQFPPITQHSGLVPSILGIRKFCDRTLVTGWNLQNVHFLKMTRWWFQGILFSPYLGKWYNLPVFFASSFGYLKLPESVHGDEFLPNQPTFRTFLEWYYQKTSSNFRWNTKMLMKLFPSFRLPLPPPTSFVFLRKETQDGRVNPFH